MNIRAFVANVRQEDGNCENSEAVTGNGNGEQRETDEAE